MNHLLDEPTTRKIYNLLSHVLIFIQERKLKKLLNVIFLFFSPIDSQSNTSYKFVSLFEFTKSTLRIELIILFVPLKFV